MTEKYTRAKFWKCALQVNPASYMSAYRGSNHDMTEEDYNQALLTVCKKQGIKVLGIADHGKVDAVDGIRNLMQANEILVFPGFEISSSEKVHFVCLFSEQTTREELERCLGNLGMLDPENGIRPSILSAEQIFSKIEESNGFVYAAHCTNESGVLKKHLNQVWQNPLLKAAQIPGSIEELKSVEGDFYRKVLLNKESNYKREQPMGVINAKDVAQPEDLANPGASCLIKMTRPSFESFKLAFQDPESRLRLNSEVSETYYSRIEMLSVTGGYLDGLHIEFSEHLNAVIGGRGTGKSTLIACIRHTLQLEPLGEKARKQHKEIIKENLGKSRARIELRIRSSKMNGKRFTVARRYGESASVKDDNGVVSTFSPGELLPEIELYGQNEIYEIAQDTNLQHRLLRRFLEAGTSNGENKIKDVLIALAENRKNLQKSHAVLAATEDELARLPKLMERIDQFKTLGIEEKLKIVPLLENEKRHRNRIVDEELQKLENAFLSVAGTLPDTAFLSDKAVQKLPHAAVLREIKTQLDQLKSETEETLGQWRKKFDALKNVIISATDKLKDQIEAETQKLEKTFKELPATEGKSGREIGVEFQELLKEIERIKPRQSQAKNQQNVTEELEKRRKQLLDELSQYRSARSATFERSIKKLSKKLEGKLKLTLQTESDRMPVIDFLMRCDLEGVGQKRLDWIKQHDDFSPVKLAELIRKGIQALENSNWSIASNVAGNLLRLTRSQIMQLEELELPDVIQIELNTAHEGEENFRPLEKLSTGQQCTAILHLLLLQSQDPLIVDQPEDNLDNAFIADRIVVELRQAKTNRQFIFATHNANIPVFGDAEWIGIFEADKDRAFMPDDAQGAIDVPEVRNKTAVLLEGGKTAFNRRKDKYGF